MNEDINPYEDEIADIYDRIETSEKLIGKIREDMAEDHNSYARKQEGYIRQIIAEEKKIDKLDSKLKELKAKQESINAVNEDIKENGS